jgi:hypothetical protein
MTGSSLFVIVGICLRIGLAETSAQWSGEAPAFRLSQINAAFFEGTQAFEQMHKGGGYRAPFRSLP